MIISGGTTPIYNPLFKGGEIEVPTTYNQLTETYNVVNDLITNLDDLAISELNGGMGGDLDTLMDELLRETYTVLYGNPLKKRVATDGSYAYMKALNENIEETLRCSNLNYFISSVLTGFDINWHHLEWGQHVQQFNKLCVIAPRDHGKSYFFSHAYALWKLYRYKGNKVIGGRMVNDILNARGFIMSNEMDLTEELLETIKISIEENDTLREKLLPINPNGQLKRDWWSKRSIRTEKGSRINLKSYGGSFRGRHPGWIVVDDFMKDNVIYSELQRKKVIDYFHSVIMNAVIPKGQVIAVGTPFHAADLYADLKDKRGARGWRVFEYPAISPEGKVLWADRYSYDDLMDKRESQGNIIFSRELLCRPIVSDSSLFPWSILSKSLIGMDKYNLVSNIDSFPIKFRKVVTGCDFAYSASVAADFSVFSTWGIDFDNNMWLIHLWRGKGKTYKEQIQVIKTINRNFRPDYIVCEANVFQHILVDILEDEGLTNVVPHVTTGSNKTDMISGVPGMTILFEQGRVKLPYGDQYSKNVVDLVLSELGSIGWTNKGIESIGQHDDTVMSMFMAKRGFTYMGSGKWHSTFL